MLATLAPLTAGLRPQVFGGALGVGGVSARLALAGHWTLFSPDTVLQEPYAEAAFSGFAVCECLRKRQHREEESLHLLLPVAAAGVGLLGRHGWLAASLPPRVSYRLWHKVWFPEAGSTNL